MADAARSGAGALHEFRIVIALARVRPAAAGRMRICADGRASSARLRTQWDDRARVLLALRHSPYRTLRSVVIFAR